MNEATGDRPAERQRLAERVRAALVQAALDGYEDAALRGLCCEGAWEAAISAMRGLDLSKASGDAPRREA